MNFVEFIFSLIPLLLYTLMLIFFINNIIRKLRIRGEKNE